MIILLLVVRQFNRANNLAAVDFQCIAATQATNCRYVCEYLRHKVYITYMLALLR